MSYAARGTDVVQTFRYLLPVAGTKRTWSHSGEILGNNSVKFRDNLTNMLYSNVAFVYFSKSHQIRRHQSIRVQEPR